MNASRISTLALATLLAMQGFFISGAAFAQDQDPCAENGALMSAARQAQAERAKEIEDHARNVYGPMAKSPDWLSDSQSLLSNCVADQYGDWKVSTGSAIFDQIANKAKDAAIDKACAEQRKRVAEYTSDARGYLSRIPGYQNIGSQGSSFPSGAGGMNYDDLIGNIGGGNQTPNIPNIPGPGSGGNIPGVSNPRPNPSPTPIQRNPPGGIPGVSPIP